MNFAEVVNSRHSVRDFSHKPVEHDTLMCIAQLAQRTPTWVNAQPAKIYYVTCAAAEKLRTEHEKRVDAQEPSHSEIDAMPRENWPQRNQDIMAQWTTEFKQKFAPGQVHFNHAQKVLYNAPAFAFITIPRGIFDWALFDAGAFANTLMLAAKSEGVDSIVAYATVIYPDLVRQIAQIPEDELLVVGIGLGYASEDALNTFVPSRVPTEEVVRFISE